MKASRAAAAVASHFDLPALPFEIQLCVAAAVASPRDRAALSLALPPLGLAAARGLAALYRSFDMGVAMMLVADALPVDEALLRRYVRDSRSGEQRLSPRLSEAFR